MGSIQSVYWKASWAVLVVAVAILRMWTKSAEGAASPTTPTNALEAAKQLQSWSTWTVGVASGAIALLGFLLKEWPKREALTWGQEWAAFFVLLFFGVSIVLSTHVVYSIATIMARLPAGEAPSAEADIFHLPLYGFMGRPELGPASAVQQLLFVAGILSLGVFLVTATTSSR